MNWPANIWRNHLGKLVLLLCVLAYTSDDLASSMFWKSRPPGLPPLVNIQVDRAHPSQSRWVQNAYIQEHPSASQPSIVIGATEDLSSFYLGFPLMHTEQIDLTYSQNRFTQETYRPDEPHAMTADAEALHQVFSQIEPLSSWLPTVESADTLINDGRMRRSSFIWINFIGLSIRTISLLLATAFFVLLFKRDKVEAKRYKRKQHGKCTECGYQLDLNLEQCPECGTNQIKH